MSTDEPAEPPQPKPAKPESEGDVPEGWINTPWGPVPPKGRDDHSIKKEIDRRDEALERLELPPESNAEN